MTTVLTTHLPPIEVAPAVQPPRLPDASTAAEQARAMYCPQCEVGWRGVDIRCWSCDNEGKKRYGPGS